MSNIKRERERENIFGDVEWEMTDDMMEWNGSDRIEVECSLKKGLKEDWNNRVRDVVVIREVWG